MVQRGRFVGLDVLRSGQIVNLDFTLEKNGDIADSSTTYLVWRCVRPAQARRHRLRHRALRSL
ncbi:methionine aminopeptidase [Xanthomonas translucens]|nr:methionine aminopeptidase [Xanthomonas translucens]